MPGTPVRNKLLKDIELKGGWEWVLERIASGETQTKIAKELGVSLGFFSTVLNSDPERKQQLDYAKKRAALALAEEAMQVVDDAKQEREALTHAKMRADVRMMLASKYDREQYGEQKQQIAVNLTVESLHLGALRRREPEQVGEHTATDGLVPRARVLDAVVESVESGDDASAPNVEVAQQLSLLA